MFLLYLESSKTFLRHFEILILSRPLIMQFVLQFTDSLFIFLSHHLFLKGNIWTQNSKDGIRRECRDHPSSAHWYDCVSSWLFLLQDISNSCVSCYFLPNAFFSVESHCIHFHPYFYNLLILFMCSLPAHTRVCCFWTICTFIDFYEHYLQNSISCLFAYSPHIFYLILAMATESIGLSLPFS